MTKQQRISVIVAVGLAVGTGLMTLNYLSSVHRLALSDAGVQRAVVISAADIPARAVITEATDPVLRPIRRHVPPLGGLDLSPLIALLLISVVETLLLGLLGGH